MKLLYMQIKINSTSFFIFDLDDTLFQEIDYLKSAYKYISLKLEASIHCNIYDQMLHKYHNKENVFEWVLDQYQPLFPELDLTWLLKEYREHVPTIVLREQTTMFLKILSNGKYPLV